MGWDSTVSPSPRTRAAAEAAIYMNLNALFGAKSNVIEGAEEHRDLKVVQQEAATHYIEWDGTRR